MKNLTSKIFITTTLLVSLLESRENPFFPKDGMEDIPYSSNLNSISPPLKRATIKLPSQAREIQKVTLTYKNLDGSVEEQSIELSNSIDWHLPIFISQSYENSSANIVNIKNDVQEVKVAEDKKVDISKKNVINEKHSNKDNFKLLADKQYIKFSEDTKTLKIETKNELMRDFLLVKPHRIVLDFKKIHDSFLQHFSKDNPNSVFKNITIGNHKGYYRVVIELDGFYRYKYEQTSDGFIFKLI
ncbi:MAG: AMIN domain-containing protein [Campylobacterales bacterium]|nr:AMIN domain-containing protein [Campylobacterales bacterium]